MRPDSRAETSGLKRRHFMGTAIALDAAALLAACGGGGGGSGVTPNPNSSGSSSPPPEVGVAGVSTLAGMEGQPGSANGSGTLASFNTPYGLAIDSLGNVYVADSGNHLIRKITPAGLVTTLAGTGTQGSFDGMGTSASFNSPHGLAVDSLGNVYVADDQNHRIRKISTAGSVTTLAGSTHGNTDGTGTAAQFDRPRGVAVDGAGNLFVTDYYNHRIRKIDSEGVVSTFAGSTEGLYGWPYDDGTGTAGAFSFPSAITLDANGNLYVTEVGIHRIRKISQSAVVTTWAGDGLDSYLDDTGIAAQFNFPSGITVDANGFGYVGDTFNNRIRLISPQSVVSTIAGNGTAGAVNGNGSFSAVTFNRPYGVVLDNSGNLFVADSGNHLIRKIPLR
ncbi:MAG: hypothetical protein RIT26_312 [Pseudomonadota bacterium]